MSKWNTNLIRVGSLASGASYFIDNLVTDNAMYQAGADFVGAAGLACLGAAAVDYVEQALPFEAGRTRGLGKVAAGTLGVGYVAGQRTVDSVEAELGRPLSTSESLEYTLGTTAAVYNHGLKEIQAAVDNNAETPYQPQVPGDAVVGSLLVLGGLVQLIHSNKKINAKNAAQTGANK